MCVCVFWLTGLSVVLHRAAVTPVWVGQRAIATNAGFHWAEKRPEQNKNDLAQYAPSFLSLFFLSSLADGSSQTQMMQICLSTMLLMSMYPTKSPVLIFGGRTRAPFSAVKDDWPWFWMILDYQVLQQEAILGSAQIVSNLTIEGSVSHARSKIQDPEQRGLDLPVKTNRCSLSLVSHKSNMKLIPSVWSQAVS